MFIWSFIIHSKITFHKRNHSVNCTPCSDLFYYTHFLSFLQAIRRIKSALPSIFHCHRAVYRTEYAVFIAAPQGRKQLCFVTVARNALDDRFGCAVLVDMIQKPLKFDMWFTFTVQEEVGCRGAKCAAFSVDPDFAFVIESTTAADLHDVPPDKAVCVLGQGAAVSFMDNGTLYDRDMYKFVLDNCRKNDIAIQLKTAAKGGNNASAVHLSRKGVRTCAISLPCRYIHSQYCVAHKNDVTALQNAVKCAAQLVAGGAIE